MTEITYDSEVKILMIHLNDRKISDSEMQNDNCIIDYDKNGEIVSIEILNIEPDLL